MGKDYKVGGYCDYANENKGGYCRAVGNLKLCVKIDCPDGTKPIKPEDDNAYTKSL